MSNLFVLIDIRLEPQKIDLEFLEWLGENGIPFSIIFTKADKLTAGKQKDNVNNTYVSSTRHGKSFRHFCFFSREETGKKEILDYIENINQDSKVLNKGAVLCLQTPTFVNKGPYVFIQSTACHFLITQGSIVIRLRKR